MKYCSFSIFNPFFIEIISHLIKSIFKKCHISFICTEMYFFAVPKNLHFKSFLLPVFSIILIIFITSTKYHNFTTTLKSFKNLSWYFSKSKIFNYCFHILLIKDRGFRKSGATPLRKNDDTPPPPLRRYEVTHCNTEFLIKIWIRTSKHANLY